MSKPKPSPTMKTIRSLVKDSGRSLRDITAGTGISYVTLHRWMHEDGDSVVRLETLLGALGYELAVVPLGHDAVARAVGDALTRKPRVMRSLAKILDENRDLLS